MGAPVSLLGNARAFARDFARDQMPAGFLWDVVDFVPAIIDASLTSRGGWTYSSAGPSGDGKIESGIYATFVNGDQRLVQTTASEIVRVMPDGTLYPLGAGPRSIQNPIQLNEVVVHFDGTPAGGLPQLWRDDIATPLLVGHFGGHRPRVGTVWKGAVISGGEPNDEEIIRYSIEGQDLSNGTAYDANRFNITSDRITALQAMRTMVLIFHPGSVERLRGGPFPLTASGEEGRGVIIEGLFDRVGCNDPKSIATWNDQCIFADQHGVHITDGSVIRNLTSQGGILTYWRDLFLGKTGAIVGGTYMDYYIVTVPDVSGFWTTLVCDLNRRQWFRFSNINALTYFSSAGSADAEKLWAGDDVTGSLMELSRCFFPDAVGSGDHADADGLPIQPRFETAWYRLGQEGRKRIRFAYLSYDVPKTPSAGFNPLISIAYMGSPQGAFVSAGNIVAGTSGYTRRRVPLGKNPYGVAFAVAVTDGAARTRIFDLGIEAEPIERSRV